MIDTILFDLKIDRYTLLNFRKIQRTDLLLCFVGQKIGTWSFASEVLFSREQRHRRIVLPNFTSQLFCFSPFNHSWLQAISYMQNVATNATSKCTDNWIHESSRLSQLMTENGSNRQCYSHAFLTDLKTMTMHTN